MIKRRRGQLDLAALGQAAVQRHDFAQDFQVLGQQDILVVFRVVAALVAQFPQGVVALEGQRVDPGQVEPHLQIAQVGRLEAAQRLRGGVAPGRAAVVQLGVTRERQDHMVRVGHEEMVEQV